MKKLLAIIALCCATSAQGALLTVPGGAVTTTATVGGVTVVVPVAGATVTWCTQQGSGIPCSPNATVYTNQGLTGSPTTNIGTTNAQGTPLYNGQPNIWAQPGTYVYTVTGSTVQGSTFTITTPVTCAVSGGCSVPNLTSTHPSITPTSIEAVEYADQFPGANDAAKIAAAITSAGNSNAVVVAPSNMTQGALPVSVPNTLTYMGWNGNSATSPTGLMMTSGCAPETGLTNRVLFNLKQCSVDPKTAPQNSLYIEQTVSGDLSGNTQNVNWALFTGAQVQNITAASDFEEEDGAEIEASALGTGTPPDFRLVSLGAQSWIRNTASDSITIPYAISMWARAPFVSGSGGTASVGNAWSLMATQPEIGTSDNAAVVLLTDHANKPLTMEWQTAGIPVWEMSVANGSVQTDDFTIGAQSVPTGYTGSDIYLSHGGPEGGAGANAPLYLTSGGAGSVIVNAEPTHPNGAAHTNGTGGLVVSTGGPSGSLAPYASVGLIRIPNNAGVVARNAGNTADITLIQSTATNKVSIDANANGTVAGGSLAWGGGSAIPSSDSVVKVGSDGLSAGTITVSSSTSGSHAFTTAYSAAPTCTVTEAGSTPAALNPAVTSSTTAVTVTVAVSGTYTFNFQCVPAVN